MSLTVLYSENVYPDDSVERRIYAPDLRVIFPRASSSLADLSDEDCTAADGLMTALQGHSQGPGTLPTAACDLPHGRGL